MKTKLTTREAMRSRNGTEYGTGPIFRYRVDGMPQGQEAFIVNVHSGTPRAAKWRVKGVNADNRTYETAEEALAALQKQADER